jgi:hypothetical protein
VFFPDTVIQASRLYPRGPRSSQGYIVPVHQHLLTSSESLTDTPRFPGLAGYTRSLCCTGAPRPSASGSELSLLILSQHVVLCDSGESGGCMHPVPSPPMLAFVSSVQTRHSRDSHKSASRGGHISELHYGSLSLRPADLFTLLSDRTGLFTQPTRTFTAGLSTDWSPAPPPAIATVATG